MKTGGDELSGGIYKSLVVGFCRCKNCGAEKFCWNTYFKCKECGSNEYETTGEKDIWKKRFGTDDPDLVADILP